MLLIVTLVLTTLALSGAALLTLMKTENEATSTRGRESLVKGVDRSAVVFLIATLQSTQQEREQMGGLYDNAQYFCGSQLLSMDEGGADTSRFTVLSPKITDSEIEGVRYGLVDESTRLNLEAVLQWDRESPGAGRQALMKLPGMTQIAADSILDWIDPDESQRQFGAEARYYSDRKLPYSPRNATPVFLEELLLARGVTRSQLYGTDENFTYNVDKIKSSNASNALGGSLLSAPTESANVGGVSVPWKELVTVFSAEKDVDPTGAARVDLNVDNLEFLYQELASRVGEDVAKFAVLYRQYGAANATSEGGATGGSSARGRGRTSGYAGNQGGTGRGGAQRNAGGRSGYFASAPNDSNNDDGATPGNLAQATIDYSTPATVAFDSPLDLVGARVVVNGVAYNSPIPDSRSSDAAEKLFKLLDYCSTNASTTIVGRVNVNGAPRAVLSALPGLAPSDVERIMQRRPDMSKSLPADFRHASWLYTKGLVSLAQMKTLYNKTTARGDVYRGQIVGFLERSDETSRAEVVVDGSTEPPRQVFYKDLTTLGKGFSDVVLLGGASVGSESTLSDGTVDWDATTSVFEIENGERSGYLNQGGDGSSQLSDPFAAVEAATGGAASGNAANDLLGAGLGSGLDAGLGGTQGSTSEQTLGASPSSDAGLGLGGLDAGGVASGMNLGGAPSESAQQPSASTPQSRRERMLDALRSTREERRARNQGALGATPASGESENVGVESGVAAQLPGAQPSAAPAGGSGRRGGNSGSNLGVGAPEGGNNGGNNGGNAGRNSGDAGGTVGGGRGGRSGRGGSNAEASPNANANGEDSDQTARALNALRGARGNRD